MTTCPKCRSDKYDVVGFGEDLFHYRCLACGFTWTEIKDSSHKWKPAQVTKLSDWRGK